VTPLLDGKTAIVTGAGRGLGREEALALARYGARVIVNDIGASLAGEGRDHSAAAEVVATIEAAGGTAVVNGDDVADWQGKWNDSVWVQFSGAQTNGSPAYPIGSSSGLLVNLATDAGAASLSNWGWQNGAYWLSQPTRVTFAAGGTQTLRVQTREDGVEIDQIVLSPVTFLTSAPGPASNDSTIVPKP
jgi:NAD(P)-dependent dehydrogenase (short-subunit alcohol dehydrogenase family)